MWGNLIKITALSFLFVFFTIFLSFNLALADPGVTIKGNVSIYDFESGGNVDKNYGDFDNFHTTNYKPLKNALIEVEFAEWTIADVQTMTDENGNFSVSVRDPKWGSWHVDIEVNAWVELDYNSGEPITADCFEDSEDLFKYNFQTGERSVGKNGTLTYDVKIGGPDNNIEDYWDADLTFWDGGAGTGLNHIAATFMSQVINDGFDWITDRAAEPEDIYRTTCIIYPSDETGISGFGASNIDKYKPYQLPPGTGHIHIIPRTLFPSQYTQGNELNPIGYYWSDLRCTVLHEYGHKIMHDVYWELPKPLSFWDSIDSEHTCSTCRTPELGWTEGWAEFFAAAVQNWPTVNGEKTISACNIDQVGTMDMSNYDMMIVEPEEQGQLRWHSTLGAHFYDGKHDMNEGEVAAVLWDIFDPNGWEYMPNMVQNLKPVTWQNQSFLKWYDRLEDPNLDKIWSIIRDSEPDCLMDEADAQSSIKIEDSFWYYWLQKYGNDSELVHGLKAILYNRSIPSTKKPENAPTIISSSIDMPRHRINLVIEEQDPEDQPYLYYNVEYRTDPNEWSKLMYIDDKLLSSLSTNWTNNRLTVSIDIPSSSQWGNLLLRVHDSMLPVFLEYSNDTTTTTTTEEGVEDKGDLTLLGSCNTPSYVEDLEVVDNYVHLVDGSTGYYVIDVSDPANPQNVASFKNWERCSNIDTEDYYAYITNLSGDLRIVDISDPLHPVEVTCLDLVNSVKEIANRIIGAAPLDIEVAGDYAYIICNECFYIIDVSDKSNPFAVGYADFWGSDLDVGGNYVFVNDQSKGLHVLDVSNPTKPTEVGQCIINGDFYQTVIDPDLSHAYLTDDEKGLLTFDISDPLNPVLVSTFDTPNSAQGVAFKNNLVYIADYDALRIINVSSPQSPLEIKSFIVPSSAKLPHLHCLVVDNDHVYVGTAGGLAIFGYTN